MFNPARSKKGMVDHFIDEIPDQNELEDFAYWAFGQNFRQLEGGMQFLDNWNFNHGEKLRISSDGVISEDAPRMVALWKAREK